MMAEKSPGGQRNASDTHDGNKEKFAWFYAMNADSTVSIAAKAVGGVCVMKLAGRKGHFKATYKSIANLCGSSQRTVRRALADLIDKRYLHADIHEGSASTYYLNPPVQRLQDWLDAEWDYKSDIDRATREWLSAEKKHNYKQVQDWLLAEKQFQENKEEQFRFAVFGAGTGRGIPAAVAWRVADVFLDKYREHGYELDPVDGIWSVNSLSQETVSMLSAPGTTPAGDPDPNQKWTDPLPDLATPPTGFGQTPDQIWPHPLPDLATPLSTLDSSSSANNQTLKSFKDSERSVKTFQDSESGTALRGALNARPPHGPASAATDECELCGGDGIFLDADGYPIVLIDDDCVEYEVECQHSMAANLAHIQRREKEEDRSLCRTDWSEIDSHYPYLINP